MHMALFNRIMNLLFKRHRLQPKTELVFLKRLVRLLETGYPLLKCLEMIAWDKRLETLSNQVIDSLKAGCFLDEALKEANCSNFITEQIYFSRFNGDLLNTLKKCQTSYEQRISYREKLFKVIRYPIMLLMIFSILMYFIKSLVLPAFLDMFEHQNSSKQTVKISMLLMDIGLSVVIITFCCLVLSMLVWRFSKKHLHIREQLKLYQSIPIFRRFLKWRISYQMSYHISALLTAGLSFHQVIKQLSEQNQLSILRYYAFLIKERLSEGQNISTILQSFYFIDDQITFIFEQGQEVETLSKDLATYSTLLIDYIEEAIMKILTYIQPIFFGLIACFIVLIYLSLLYPMFQLLQSL